MAQKVDLNPRKPLKPKAKPKKLTAEAIANIDRPFPELGPAEPNDFQYELYASVFNKIMNIAHVIFIMNFDHLDPKHLANAVYRSYTIEARANIVADLHLDRCKHALTYQPNTHPHQVKAVRQSMINLVYISEEDISAIVATPRQNPRTALIPDSRT
ncbi:uncharacterized protein EV154DRAFT_488268 [Mucor mucedo]|uniref:uncharacterized protein n=1 Tax=Mucor mucedo TaxID=29922 RepID=UPI0022200A43|nr:uncharacterized protein EV154DRAFT_488268 [Mucor mucedo]KAI7867769.1 hypothetical protein EV154DRAFT_488268 [Mucor mucedo]